MHVDPNASIFFKLGFGLGHGPRSGPLFFNKKWYSDGLRVGKTLVCPSNSGSVKILLTPLTTTHVEGW
jgi:hypothetical protein